MSRVRLTGPYRYLIYVTPDYAIVEGLNGLDLGTGPLQESDTNQLTILGLFSDSLVLVRTKKVKKKLMVND